MRVLLIEDDPMLGASLKKGLALEGFSPERVTTLEAARDAMGSVDAFDALVLDLNLPDGNGMNFLAELRQSSKNRDIPVLLLTARNATSSKIEALDRGADDYLTKPFDLKELAARLRAILRRRHGHVDSMLESLGLSLNLSTGVVTYEGNKTYRPTAHELKLLTLLMQRPGKVISKGQIEENLYGWESGADSNIVEVTVYNLRKQLGKSSIVTLRGVGYMAPPL